MTHVTGTAAPTAPAGPQAVGPARPAAAKRLSVAARHQAPAGRPHHEAPPASPGPGGAAPPPPAPQRARPADAGAFRQLAQAVRARRPTGGTGAMRSGPAVVPRGVPGAGPLLPGARAAPGPRRPAPPGGEGAPPARVHTGPVVVARQAPAPAEGGPQAGPAAPGMLLAAGRGGATVPIPEPRAAAKAVPAALSETPGRAPHAASAPMAVRADLAPASPAPRSAPAWGGSEIPLTAAASSAALGRAAAAERPVPPTTSAPPRPAVPASLPLAGWRVSGLMWRAPAGLGQAVQFRINPPGTRLSAVLVRMAQTAVGAHVVLSVRSAAWLKSLEAGKAGLASQLEAPLGATVVDVTSGAGFGFSASADAFQDRPGAPYSGGPPGAGAAPAQEARGAGLDLRA